MKLRNSTAILLLAGVALTAQTNYMQSKLIIVDPGHFHATLLQKDMYPWVDPRVTVYAPLGPDLLDYLNRISLFNARPDNPTRWALDIHTSSDPMAEMLRGRAGNIVVFTGRNRGKIDRILAALNAGLNVLADKPWIITPADLPKLEEALALAQRKNLAAYDIMTERYEVTSQLQREFVNDREVFGTLENVRARSIHHVMKVVAGTPLRRPPWFFDIDEYGEGLADVGTHVVDLVQWTAFPDQALDYRKDIEILAGRRWPLKMTKEQFTKVTGDADFPAALTGHVHGGVLDYYCNNSVAYKLRGIPVEMEILWNWEAAEGGDVYEASFRGSKSRVEIRQGKAERFIPEVYIGGANAEVAAAVEKRVEALQTRWPGLAAVKSGEDLRIVVPEKFRVGHEAHFGQVSNRFFEYVTSPKSLPVWETPYMLAKYAVSTKGVERGEAMKKLLLILVLALALAAQESRREITNAAANPADDKKGLSDKVPDVYPVSTQFDRVVLLRFKFDTDLLAGLEKMVKQEKISNAIILSGMGSVRGYQVHQVSNRGFPSKNMFVKNPTEPADIVGMSGFISNGVLHPHITLATPDKAFGGHLEPGTNVFTFAFVTLGVLKDGADLSHVDDKGYR